MNKPKIIYLSDIHLELLKKSEIEIIQNSIIPQLDYICVLAGDIGNPFHESYTKFLITLSNKFKKIFIIAGNHEFYNNVILDTIEKINKIITTFTNITFLNNSCEIYDDYLFVGTTLWSNITDYKHTINDLNYIKNITIPKYNYFHSESLTFLNNILSSDLNKNIIIVTHHMPSFTLINSDYLQYPYSLYNQWFASELDYLFVNPNIKFWIYGHTHIPNITKINDIQFVCNPIGYKYENDIQTINYNKIL